MQRVDFSQLKVGEIVFAARPPYYNHPEEKVNGIKESPIRPFLILHIDIEKEEILALTKTHTVLNSNLFFPWQDGSIRLHYGYRLKFEDIKCQFQIMESKQFERLIQELHFHLQGKNAWEPEERTLFFQTYQLKLVPGDVISIPEMNQTYLIVSDSDYQFNLIPVSYHAQEKTVNYQSLKIEQYEKRCLLQENIYILHHYTRMELRDLLKEISYQRKELKAEKEEKRSKRPIGCGDFIFLAENSQYYLVISETEYEYSALPISYSSVEQKFNYQDLWFCQFNKEALNAKEVKIIMTYKKERLRSVEIEAKRKRKEYAKENLTWFRSECLLSSPIVKPVLQEEKQLQLRPPMHR